MTNEKRAFSNDQFKEFAKEHPEMQLDSNRQTLPRP